MDCNSKLFLELGMLWETIDKENKELKFRLDNDDEFDKPTDELAETTFGQLLYTIVKDLTNKEMLDLTDEEMTKHIQKLQIKERE